MKKVTLIGDCHTARILEHWNPETCPVAFQAWGKGGTSAWHAEPKVLAERMEKSSATETQPIYVPFRESLFLRFNEIKDQDLIIVWIGYVDARQYLPKYDNADEVIKKCIERFLEYFKGTEVRFMEPLPQFLDMLMKEKGLHEEYSFEQRLEQNNKVIAAIKKYSKAFGLQDPITQEQIFKAVGLTQDQLTADKTPQVGFHPVDTFQQKYMSKIYDLIIEEAEK